MERLRTLSSLAEQVFVLFRATLVFEIPHGHRFLRGLRGCRENSRRRSCSGTADSLSTSRRFKAALQTSQISFQLRGRLITKIGIFSRPSKCFDPAGQAAGNLIGWRFRRCVKDPVEDSGGCVAPTKGGAPVAISHTVLRRTRRGRCASPVPCREPAPRTCRRRRPSIFPGRYSGKCCGLPWKKYLAQAVHCRSAAKYRQTARNSLLARMHR